MAMNSASSAHIATEMVVPIVTNCSATPIMTIILQVLRDQETPKEEKEDEEQIKETIKHEMTSAWRVISFFFIVFVLPTIMISVPLYARYHIYHAKNHFLTDGDMQSFHDDVSSFWCQGQRLISNGSFEAYLTKETRRAKTKRISTLSTNLLLMHDEIEEWGVHLIRGSHFKFSACSRWPGGTLLVVQGEENMRRCFYKEERFEDELHEEEENKKRKKTVDNLKGDLKYDEILMGEGEILDNYEELKNHEIIRKLYSSTRSNTEQSTTNQKYDTTTPSTQTDTNFNATNINTFSTEATVSKTDLIKVSKKVKNIKEKKRQRKRKNQNKKKINATINNATNEDDSKGVVKLVKRAVNTTKLESLMADKGSLFYNINDTLDVTSGNSSFSSSEEFLRQCSTTIVSIDLTPYPDCSQRTADLNDSSSSMTWKFRVNHTDYYYFIFTSDNSLEANIISFNMLLERRLYNVSDYLDKCSNTSECVFPFSFLKSEGVIVDFSEHYEKISNLDDLHNYEITAICQPRTVVYTVFILCVPFIIILFAFR